MLQTRLLYSQFCYDACLINSHLFQWDIKILGNNLSITRVLHLGMQNFVQKKHLVNSGDCNPAEQRHVGIHETHTPQTPTVRLRSPRVLRATSAPSTAPTCRLISDNLLLPLPKTSQAATLPMPTSMREHQDFFKVNCRIYYSTMYFSTFNTCKKVQPFLWGSYLFKKCIPDEDFECCASTPFPLISPVENSDPDLTCS